MLKKFIVLVSSLLFLYAPTLSAEERGIKATTSEPQKPFILGNYYAFIVGINAYKEWYPLKTAVKDARALGELLIAQYSFDRDKVLLMIDQDATQLNVINALKKLAASLSENDNLLIYYAGHGQLDEFTGVGYWIPVDGQHKNASTWISHYIIISILSSERVKAKNIALISDSCYAGALLRSGPSPVSTTDDKYLGKILALSARKSRQVFTSGGLEPVADGGRDGHSLFAYYFLKALKENKREIIDLENLFFSQVWEPVVEIGDQRPYVGRIKTLMDENGQFILITRSAKNTAWDQHVAPNYASISPEQYHKSVDKPRFNPAEPWSAIWDVEGSPLAEGQWAMKQNGGMVNSTGDSFYELKGSAEGTKLNGTLKGGSGEHFSFIVSLSSDGSTFEGKLNNYRRVWHIKGKRKTEKIANISPAIIDPTEPWTGVWRVEGSRSCGGIWGMKQSGRIVKSTGDSYFEIRGKVSGNQLKGRMVGDYDIPNRFVLNISSDRLSFKGTITSDWQNMTRQIKGTRK